MRYIGAALQLTFSLFHGIKLRLSQVRKGTILVTLVIKSLKLVTKLATKTIQDNFPKELKNCQKHIRLMCGCDHRALKLSSVCFQRNSTALYRVIKQQLVALMTANKNVKISGLWTQILSTRFWIATQVLRKCHQLSSEASKKTCQTAWSRKRTKKGIYISCANWYG